MKTTKQISTGTGTSGEVRVLTARPAPAARVRPNWSRFWEALRRSLGAVCC